MPQLRSKFQVSTFSRFKVTAFSIFVYEFVKYAGKNIRTSNAKCLESPKKVKIQNTDVNRTQSLADFVKALTWNMYRLYLHYGYKYILILLEILLKLKFISREHKFFMASVVF